jgi:hypothetical protein
MYFSTGEKICQGVFEKKSKVFLKKRSVDIAAPVFLSVQVRHGAR